MYTSKKHFLQRVKEWYLSDSSKFNIKFEEIDEGVCVIFDNTNENNLHVVELYPENLMEN